VSLRVAENREEGSEEPQAVLDEITAEVETDFPAVDLVFPVFILVVDVLGNVLVLGIQPKSVPLLAVELASGIVADQLSMELTPPMEPPNSAWYPLATIWTSSTNSKAADWSLSPWSMLVMSIPSM